MTESQGGDVSPKLWGAHRDAPLRKLGLMTLARLPQLPRLLEAEQLQLGLDQGQ